MRNWFWCSASTLGTFANSLSIHKYFVKMKCTVSALITQLRMTCLNVPHSLLRCGHVWSGCTTPWFDLCPWHHSQKLLAKLDTLWRVRTSCVKTNINQELKRLTARNFFIHAYGGWCHPPYAFAHATSVLAGKKENPDTFEPTLYT